MTKFTTADVVKYSMDSQAGKASDAIQSLLANKVADALEVKRAHIASTWLAPETNEDDDD
tara:strand:- start:342 stop:521 length:180 start_codon:yes stop_codon:yes gene_type:complete